MERGSKLEFLLRDANGRFYTAWIRCDAPPYYMITTGTSITIDGRTYHTRQPDPPEHNNYQFSDGSDDIRTILFVGGGIDANSLEEAIEKKLKPPTSITYTASSSSGAFTVESLESALSAVTFDAGSLRLTQGR